MFCGILTTRWDIISVLILRNPALSLDHTFFQAPHHTKSTVTLISNVQSELIFTMFDIMVFSTILM